MSEGSSLTISVVAPVFNEDGNILELYRRLTAVLKSLGVAYEIVFVDDASRDGSARILAELAEADPAVRTVHFSRNFGHQVAVTAGLHFARGDAVVTMDSDLQDPPELLPELIAAWRRGNKIVFARRVRREREGVTKRLFAFLYYRVLARLAEVQIPVDTGDFCLLDRQVVDLLNGMPERNRYLRGLRSWTGFSQTDVPFERPPRLAGEPKYNFWKSLGLALDGLVSFSRVPLQMATWLGFITGGFALLMMLLVIYWRFFTSSRLTGIGALTAAVFLIGAIQLITVGILGEYVGRIYEEIKNRPLYVVKDLRGFARPDTMPLPSPVARARGLALPNPPATPS